MKHSVRNRFDRSSTSYDDVAVVQKQCAHHLVDALNQICPDISLSSILDVGAGTGFVTECLLRLFPHSLYTVNDMSGPMLACAQKKLKDHAQVMYYRGDMETEDFKSHDLVISNLALQWVDSLEQTIQHLYARTQKVFAFSTLIQGTFEEWGALLQTYGITTPLSSYPSALSLETFLTSLTPKLYICQTLEFPLHFQDISFFLRYIQKLGASWGTVPLSTLRHLIRHHSHPLDVTYKVFFCVLKRF